jgi:adenylylsulfate kinase
VAASSRTELWGKPPAPSNAVGPIRTVWLTGLPSSGKSTIARALVARLREAGERAELLDGDEVRVGTGLRLGYSRDDRDANVRLIGWTADLLSRNGIWAVCAVVSPYRVTREQVRDRHQGRFLEVWVSAPLEICARRDVKGLYRRQRTGEITGLTGVDDPYEPPTAPDVVLASHEIGCEACADVLWAAISGAS